MRFSKIYIYDEPSVPELQLDSLVDFLKDTFDVPVEKRPNIFSKKGIDIAHAIACSRVFNTKQEFQRHEPTEEEVQFELDTFQDSSKSENIILYDGFEFQKIVRELIPNEESENFHIIITNKLTCTFDYADYRYHGRALIGANPSTISTTGIIEAPAKPREYYMELMTSMGIGLNVDVIQKNTVDSTSNITIPDWLKLSKDMHYRLFCTISLVSHFVSFWIVEQTMRIGNAIFCIHK